MNKVRNKFIECMSDDFSTVMNHLASTFQNPT